MRAAVLGTHRRQVTAVLVAVCLTVTVPAVAQPDEEAAYDRAETFIESGDGILLHTVIFRPAGLGPDDPTPTLVTVTPYSHNMLSMKAVPEEAVRRGWTAVNVQLRGFAQSEGCSDMGGRGEQLDAVAAVEWAASQPWSTGQVAMVGGSYFGWTQLMALRHRPEALKAIVIGAPASGYEFQFVNGVRAAIQGWGVPHAYGYPSRILLNRWAQEPDKMARGPVQDRPDCYTAGFLSPPDDPGLGHLDHDPDGPFWRERDVVRSNWGSDIPTLWQHGFQDWDVQANVLELYRSFTGPKSAILHQGGHEGPESSLWPPFVVDWLDHFVRGEGAQPPDLVEVEESTGRWRREAAWPPADIEAHSMPIAPGQYLDTYGNHSQRKAPPGFVSQFNNVGSEVAAFWRDYEAPITGMGSWTFSQPLPHDVHLAGMPMVDVQVAAAVPGAHLVPLLYDVDPGGAARLISRGAMRLEGPGTVRFETIARDWTVPAGHRLGLLLAAGDFPWLDGGKSNTPVVVQGGSLTLPTLPCVRRSYIPAGQQLFGPPQISPSPPFVVDTATIQSRSVTFSDLPAPLEPCGDEGGSTTPPPCERLPNRARPPSCRVGTVDELANGVGR